MIVAPPLEAPSVHTRPIWFCRVTKGLSTRVAGASGTSTIIAPLPTGDAFESPYAFVALTLTLTPSPYASENGLAIRVVKGTAHWIAAMIAALDPSQLVGSVR